MGLKKKTTAIGAALICAVVFSVGEVFAYSLDAMEIYRQARNKNHHFLTRIARYRGAIDMVNRVGDTAYCVSLKYNDKQAGAVLEEYGANANHPCAERFRKEERNRAARAASGSFYGRSATKTAGTSFLGADNKYLWWGLGAAVVGGGAIALASSGGGGGSSSHHSEINVDLPGGNTGGNEGGSGSGDNTGGNEGGSGSGDNTGGNEGGSGSGDNTGGNEGGSGSGDNTGGNEGGSGSGDNTGGNEGGSGSGGTGETTLSAAAFKTDEYNRSNFLEGINAAEAYSRIYRKDANGKLVSHQVLADEPLKKVKVGVLDTGVYPNADIADKIVGQYDLNSANERGDVWSYFAGDYQYYLIKSGDKYNFLRIWGKGIEGCDSDACGSGTKNIPQGELGSFLASKGMNFSLFTLINAAGGGMPGSTLWEKVDASNLNSWWEYVENLSHGTHVAGIIAGDKNDQGSHGVAFENAEIVAASWDFTSDISDSVKAMVDNGVSVFNHSWGSDAEKHNTSEALRLPLNDPDTVNAYAYSAAHKALWVMATGNESFYDAQIYAGLGLLNSKLSAFGYNGPGAYEVPFLAVAALDYSQRNANAPSGLLAAYSNWCGGAKGYCLAAPGTDVQSTGAVANGSMDMSGTSMATPVVSGSVALLMGYYPWLSAQNVAYILLSTANNQGEYANAEKYGQGALDLAAAIDTPIDGLSLSSDGTFSSLTPVQASRLYVSPVLKGKMLKALPETVTAFDALKRPFAYKTADMLEATHASAAALRNSVSQAAMTGKRRVVKDEKNGFSFTTGQKMSDSGVGGLSYAEVASETDTGSTRFYYAADSRYEKSEDVLRPTNNPYFAMNEAYGAENTFNLSDTSRLKLSLATGENGLYERDIEQDRHSFDERSYAMGAEYSFNITDYLELAALGGMLFENDAMLGMNGVGGFNIRDSATYYMGIKAALNLTPDFSILAAYWRGYTQGSDAAMLAFSDLQTESFMLAGEYQFNKANKAGISFSSPLSVVKGKASFNYAVGRDGYSDTVYMNKLTSSLKPAAKEYDLGVYYQGNPKEDINLMGKVQARFNADGEKGLTDYMGIVGVSASF